MKIQDFSSKKPMMMLRFKISAPKADGDGDGDDDGNWFCLTLALYNIMPESNKKNYLGSKIDDGDEDDSCKGHKSTFNEG